MYAPPYSCFFFLQLLKPGSLLQRQKVLQQKQSRKEFSVWGFVATAICWSREEKGDNEERRR
jgi:hypothetical protein